jgi:DNA-binding MarR family transcriptional regulator
MVTGSILLERDDLKQTSLLDRAGLWVYTRIMTRCYSSMLRLATRRIATAYDRALAPVGINVAQYSLLRTIQSHQPVSLTELAERAELDRSTIGRNIKVLERLGLVGVHRGDDLREAAVKLADRGVEVLNQAEPLWTDCQREVESRLGPVQVVALQEILRSIR